MEGCVGRGKKMGTVAHTALEWKTGAEGSGVHWYKPTQF